MGQCCEQRPRPLEVRLDDLALWAEMSRREAEFAGIELLALGLGVLTVQLTIALYFGAGWSVLTMCGYLTTGLVTGQLVIYERRQSQVLQDLAEAAYSAGQLIRKHGIVDLIPPEGPGNAPRG